MYNQGYENPFENLTNKEVEEVVLGTIMLYGKEFVKNVKELREDLFFFDLHKEVYRAMYELFTKNEVIDSITITQLMNKKGTRFGVTEIIRLQENTTHSFRLSEMIEILNKLNKRRTIKQKANELVEFSSDLGSDVDQLASNAIETFSDIVYQKDDKTSFKNVLESLREKVREYKEKEGEYIGMDSGIKHLNKMLEGIQKGSFIGFAAQTSRGKTWDGLNIMMNLIKQGKKVCFITLEQSPEQLMARLAGIYSGVDNRLIEKGETPEELKPKVREAMQLLVESGSTMHQETDFEKIKQILHTEALTNKPDIFFLDYIQNISSDKYRGEREKLDAVARYLQATLIKIGIPMWCLGQIDNASTKGETSDGILKFRGSGQIGHSMSVAIFKKSCHEYEEIMARIDQGIPLESYWLVEKNRDNSYLGKIKTYFHPITHKLYSEEEFEKEYGLDRYEKEVRMLPDFSSLDDAFKGGADDF